METLHPPEIIHWTSTIQSFANLHMNLAEPFGVSETFSEDLRKILKTSWSRQGGTGLAEPLKGLIRPLQDLIRPLNGLIRPFMR